MKNYTKKASLCLLAAAAAGSCLGADATVNYPGENLPFDGSASSLEINISGDTGGSIVAVGSNAQVGTQGQDSVTINYNSGNTLNYLSTIGSSGAIDGNVSINISSGSFNDQTSSPAITEAVIGTAYGKSSAVINGNVSINIQDGDFHGNIFAGGGATVKGDTGLVISGGTFSAEDGIFAGNSWGGVTEGNTSLKITGGDFSNANVYAGNHRTGSSFTQNVIKGDASLVVEGGTFKNLNGGSTDGVLGSYRLAGKIEGNTSIVVRASDNITINGDINVSSGFVDGNAEVSFVGDASKLNFSGNLKAFSSSSSSNASLGGEASIKIGTEQEAFSGDFNAKINAGFDRLEISNAATNVVFANAFEVSALEVFSESTVSVAEGTKFGTLNIVFGSEVESGADLGNVLSDIFGASEGIVESAINEGGSKFTVTGSNGDKFNAFITESGSVGVGSLIPEPSAYAALFGLAATAFAAYRRRN